MENSKEILRQFDAIMRQRAGGHRYEIMMDTISNLNQNLETYITNISVGDYIMFISSLPITDEEDSCQITNDPIPDEIVYFTIQGCTYAALMYQKNTDGKDFDSYSLKNTILHINDLRKTKDLTSLSEFYFTNSILNYIPRYTSDYIYVFPKYIFINPKFYIDFMLAPRKGMRIIRVGGILKKINSEDSVSGLTKHYHPLFTQKEQNTALFSILIADENGKSVDDKNRVRTFDSLGIDGSSVLRPYLFDSKECSTFYMKASWLIDSEIIFPQYLLMQLYEDYATTQYSVAVNMGLGVFSNMMMDNVQIYIPEGDADMSIWEQKRLFSQYKTKEMLKLSSIIGINTDPTSSLNIGTMLQRGTYTIIDSLSSGGFGKVYLASSNQEVKQYQVAIKELFVKSYCSRNPYNSEVQIPEITNKSFARQIRKFQGEFSVLSRLGKLTKYVPKTIDEPFLENNTIYYAMEYISGGTLWNSCKSNNLTKKQIVGIICQAGIALHHAHNLDYLHLDVSPLNIMLDEGGNGVLIDFGSNKHYSDDDGRITSVGQVAKTKSFAAPEMLQQVVGQYYMQSDVYSLAATLYACLTNDIPFYHSKDNDGEFRKHVSEKMKDSFVPDALSECILKALSCNIEDRPSTVLEFLHSLPQDAMNPEILKEICSLKPISGFNVKNHTAHNSEMQDSDYMPDYTSEEVSE